ncbi:MAG: hypothetical protein EPO67_22020, partial [Reyranella sp.]
MVLRPISSSQWANQFGWRSGGASHMLSWTTLNRSAWALSAVSTCESGPPANFRISSAPAVSRRFTALASTTRLALPVPAARSACSILRWMPRNVNTVHAPATSTTGLPARWVKRIEGSTSAIGKTTYAMTWCCESPVDLPPAGPAVTIRARRNRMGKWPSLDKIEMIDGPIDEDTYERDLRKLQRRLLDLQIHQLRSGGRVVICLDGWDAAGKGGLIERMVAGLEPKSVQVWRISAPTPEEHGQHYLWRFWRRLPAPGNWAIFDRTWYGRVLVERIEGFCSKDAWKRAYREINEFERQLTDDGVRIVKFLVHVSEKEQKERMIDRLSKPHKHYKIGLEDFRNIAKRKEYIEAYDDMLERTDTEHAPWHV